MNQPRQQHPQDIVWPPPPVAELPSPEPRPLTKMVVFWQVLGRATGMGLTRGSLCGAGFGFFFFIIGAVYGLFIGGVAGLVLGFILGLILAAVTCRYFYPLQDAEAYRRCVGRISTCGALFPGLLGLVEAVVAPQEWGRLVLMMLCLPSCIAAIAAWTAGWRLAAWYEAETQRRGAEQPEEKPA